MASVSHEVGGEPQHGGYEKYFLFSIPVEIVKRLEEVDYGRFKKRGERVYVRELQ
jgi:hypothetical protein